MTSAGAGEGDKGIGGSASVEVGLGIGMFTQTSPISLPDLFFSAACGHALRPGSLDFRCKVRITSRLETSSKSDRYIRYIQILYQIWMEIDIQKVHRLQQSGDVLATCSEQP